MNHDAVLGHFLKVIDESISTVEPLHSLTQIIHVAVP